MINLDISIVEQHMTTMSAPVQIEGKLSNGKRFYFRSRGRTITLGVGDTEEAAVRGDDIELGLAVIGVEDNKFPVSYLDDPHARAILGVLVGLYAAELRKEEWLKGVHIEQDGTLA